MGLRARLPHGGLRKAVLFAPAYAPGGGVPAGATFTRNLEGAQTAANGLVSYVGPNVMRESHFIGGVRVLLIEGPATNYVSSNFSDGTWSTFGQSSDALNAANGADGAANARRIAGSSGDAQIYKSVVLAGGPLDWALSYYAKSVADNSIAASMTVGMYESAGLIDRCGPRTPNATQLNTATWTRVRFSRNIATSLNQYGPQARGNGFTSSQCDISLGQLERGLNFTSPIRGAANTTRPRDSLTFPVNGTLYVKSMTPAGVVSDFIQPYNAGTPFLFLNEGDTPRGVLSIKLGLGSYSLAEMRAAV